MHCFSGTEILLIFKTTVMDIETKHGELTENESNNGKKAGVDHTFTKSDDANVGTGPSPNISDGGPEGAQKQPKEHTGKSTEMGGGSGGTSGLPDVSKGNDNTGGQE